MVEFGVFSECTQQGSFLDRIRDRNGERCAAWHELCRGGRVEVGEVRPRGLDAAHVLVVNAVECGGAGDGDRRRWKALRGAGWGKRHKPLGGNRHASRTGGSREGPAHGSFPVPGIRIVSY